MTNNKNIQAILSKSSFLQKNNIKIVLEQILEKSEEPGVNMYDFRQNLSELIESIEESQIKINRYE